MIDPGFALLGAACGGDDGSVFDGLGESTTTTVDDGSEGGNVDLDVEVDEPIRPEQPSEEVEPVAEDADTVMIAAAITTARPERRPVSTAWRAGRPWA